MKKTETILGYPVIRCDRKTVGIRVKPGGLVEIRMPKRLPLSYGEAFVKEKADWIKKTVENSPPPKEELSKEEQKRLRMLAKELLPPLTEAWAFRMGVCPKGIRITSAKTRYGSCSAKGNLCFSLYLMRSPAEAVEYVVVHELCHLKHLNHSKAFWEEVARYLPDYNERKKKLI
ncbi:MAG: M48 family metallopeptidase [Clostridia bacterium]|nr:M48 family metallopeptidase [Clostridia bacterium]